MVSWLVYTFLAAPVVVVPVASVTAEDFVAFPPRGVTARWYLAIADRPAFVGSFMISLGVAAIVAPLAAALGTLAALAIVRFEFPAKGAVVSLLLSPLMIPAIMTSIALLQLLGQNGYEPTGATLLNKQDFSISLAEGFSIKVSFGQDGGAIVKNLQLVLSTGSLQGKRNELEYVDLRFGNRVYYKMKEGEETSATQ